MRSRCLFLVHSYSWWFWCLAFCVTGAFDSDGLFGLGFAASVEATLLDLPRVWVFRGHPAGFFCGCFSLIAVGRVFRGCLVGGRGKENSMVRPSTRASGRTLTSIRTSKEPRGSFPRAGGRPGAVPTSRALCRRKPRQNGLSLPPCVCAFSGVPAGGG